MFVATVLKKELRVKIFMDINDDDDHIMDQDQQIADVYQSNYILLNCQHWMLTYKILKASLICNRINLITRPSTLSLKSAVPDRQTQLLKEVSDSLPIQNCYFCKNADHVIYF